MFGWILKCSLILFWLLHCIDGQCNRDGNGDYFFGPNCDFICHCLNKEQCDGTTGECSSGCDWQWAGQGCQYKNIALGELSRHLDNTPKYRYSDLANDKNLDTCSETDDENAETNAKSQRKISPWWKIWFPQNETFQQLTIRTKTDKKAYFRKFNVTVEYVPASSNEDKTFYPENPQICYEQRDRASESIIINVRCERPLVGNQLRIQLGSINTQLVICDIRIFQECDDGTYGKTCEYKCSGNCWNDDVCVKSSGSCPNGCKPGFKGYTCDQICEDGIYGRNCEDKCSGNCFNEDICVKLNGSCPRGCKPGYKEDRCDKMCQDGYFGVDCIHECSEHCKDICDKVNGTCAQCELGWQGVNCSEECDDGSYGENCINVCGHCKNGSTCDKTNGTCMLGCAEGYTGHRCMKGASLTKILIGVVVGAGIAFLCLIAAVVCLVLKHRRRNSSVGDNQDNQQVQRTTSDMNQSNNTDFQDQEVDYINCETHFEVYENVDCRSNPKSSSEI